MPNSPNRQDKSRNTRRRQIRPVIPRIPERRSRWLKPKEHRAGTRNTDYATGSMKNTHRGIDRDVVGQQPGDGHAEHVSDDRDRDTGTSRSKREIHSREEM